MHAIKASLVGASGYSGIELLRILSRHPHVRVEKLFANASAGKRVDEVAPRFAKIEGGVYEHYSPEAACTSDVVFLALPTGEAMNIVPELLNRGKKIVDLGGDYRLKDASEYERYYKRKHTSAHLLPKAVYGLPEWNRDFIKSADLVANPGCYPTSAVLPLLPLLKNSLIKSENIVISSLSGVSGAGRSSSGDLSFVEVNESVKAYKVGVHQHLPEIKTALSSFSGKRTSIAFVPHLIPLTRGIYTTIFAQPEGNLSAEQVTAAYQETYANKPFVRFSATAIPEIRNVNLTNFIDIGFRMNEDTDQLIILSVIDNLVKGAAGQAVQNMNIMFGFTETEGLL